MATRVNPQEYGTLQNLLGALGQGLDPTFAYQIYADTVNQAQARQQQRRAETQAQVGGLYDLATQLAQQGAAPESLENAILNRAEGVLRPAAFNREAGGLEDMVQGLFPQGSEISGLVPADVRSQLGQLPEGGFSAEDTQFVVSQVQPLAQQARQALETGQPATTTVQDARDLISAMFTASGATPEQIAMLNKLVTDTWYATGGPGMGPGGQDILGGGTQPTSGGVGSFPGLGFSPESLEAFYRQLGI